MKRSLLVIFLVGVITIVKAQVDSDQILGQWQNEKKTLTVEFYKNGATYSAKIVSQNSSNGKNGIDTDNSGTKKTGQSLIGTELISGLEFSDECWKKGKIYAPKKGIYLNCKITIKNEEMHITASKGLLSETKIWIRKK